MSANLSAVSVVPAAPVAKKIPAPKANVSFYEVLTQLTLTRKRSKESQTHRG
ncbi:hypothetical protein ACQUQU_12010 [Thalassolituus sp. LLYu03]|uniref:hypothetical protein n=1 Tax=Thalassolituus sp. LLYu03 TaxID=3421656 RepID=UPI003D2D110F